MTRRAPTVAGPPPSRTRRPSAFTLVELLVVIGIIALLISILLPTLNKARKSANTVQCMSNMRQVALAMLSYSNQNHGSLIPVRITGTTANYPYGFCWANELVREHLLSAPNAYLSASKGNFTQNSVFRCPESSDTGVFASVIGSYEPAYPADQKNNAGSIENSEKDPATGLFDYGIATWYMPVCGATGTTNTYPYPPASGTARVTPFLWLQSDADVQNSAYHRSLSLVHKGSEQVMMVEANNYNWIKEGTTTGVHLLNRLGARHGKKTADGTNAYTNMAFFDGHVATFASQPFDLNYLDTYTTGYTHQTTFFLNKQD